MSKVLSGFAEKGAEVRHWFVAVIALTMSACGTSSNQPDEQVISSDDGTAMLTLSENSLPDGVTSDDVTLHVVRAETAEIGVPVLGVQLLPDGLVLDEPATLEFDLPDAALVGFVVVHQSGDTIEFLEGSIDRDSEGTTFFTTVEHFSVVSLSVTPPAFDVSLMLDPPEVFEDEEQGATATIKTTSEPFSIWFHLSQDPADSWRLFEFGLPTAIEFNQRSGWIYWGPSRGTSWDAHENLVEIAATRSGWDAKASSTCVKANTEDVFFAGIAEYDLKVFKKGEPITRADLSMFTDVLGGESASPVDRVTFYRLANVDAGDEIRVIHSFSTSTPTVCFGESSVTSTTTRSTTTTSGTGGNDDDGTAQVPTGLDPRAHNIGITPYVTEDGTHGFILEFSQPWDEGMPVLYSFFVEVIASSGPYSITGGVQTHAGVETSLGTARVLLKDGTLAVETDLPYDPVNNFELSVRSGSQVDSGSSVAMNGPVESDVSTDGATEHDLSGAVELP